MNTDTKILNKILTNWIYQSVQFSHSVMSNSLQPHVRSTPGLPVHHRLPEFTQTHVHWVSDAIQPSHPLSFPSPPASIFPASGSFLMIQLFISGGQSIGASASAPVLSVNIQGWFPLRLTGLISLLSKGLSGVLSSTTVQRHNSLVFCLLYGPALTAIRDHWEDHSVDYIDLCRQSNVSAFQHTV